MGVETKEKGTEGACHPQGNMINFSAQRKYRRKQSAHDRELIFHKVTIWCQSDPADPPQQLHAYASVGHWNTWQEGG
jgi:hypothetical protein